MLFLMEVNDETKQNKNFCFSICEKENRCLFLPFVPFKVQEDQEKKQENSSKKQRKKLSKWVMCENVSENNKL